MIRRPPRSTLSSSSAASDVYKRQPYHLGGHHPLDRWQTPQDLQQSFTPFLFSSFADPPNLWFTGGHFRISIPLVTLYFRGDRSRGCKVNGSFCRAEA